MDPAVRILLVEDSPDDAFLLADHLRQASFEATFERVQTAGEFREALTRGPWDVVISDHSLPTFSAPEALDILNEAGLDIPFIVVSGSIGEETAVTLMHAGAHDYVLKQNLARLVPAIQRERRDAEHRRVRRLTASENQRLERERAELVERLKQENEDLNALTQITANAISTLALDDLVRTLLSRVIEVMGADAATILLADGKELRMLASYGAANLDESERVRAIGEGFEGTVAATLKPICIEDASSDPLITDPVIRARGLRHLIAVPLKRNGELIGVLHAGWLSPRQRRERDVHMLEITADRCAAAIQNARLFQDLKKAVAEVRASEGRFEAIFDAEPECVKVVAADGSLLQMNRAGLDMLEAASIEEVQEHTLLRFVEPQYRGDYDALLLRCIGGEAGRLVFEATGLRGTRRWLESHAVPLPDANGQGTRMLSVTRDITAAKNAEEAFRQSLRDQEALLKEVHHRVKNNLQLIVSLLRLESRRSTESATQHVLKDMQGRIQSMALLHEALCRSGSYADVDLSSYLSQLGTQLLRTLKPGPASIRVDNAMTPVMVGMDQAIPCGLLLHELLSNCLKHAFPQQDHGTVRVELDRVGDGTEVRLRVSDDGAGLPPDFNLTSGKSLGLQLVSDLARQLNGGLEVEAGPGAAFAVTFRVAQVERMATIELGSIAQAFARRAQQGPG
jgi:PAS domain S-box-containing protein